MLYQKRFMLIFARHFSFFRRSMCEAVWGKRPSFIGWGRCPPVMWRRSSGCPAVFYRACRWRSAVCVSTGTDDRRATFIDSEVDCGTLRCVLPPQSGFPLVALVPQAMQDPIDFRTSGHQELVDGRDRPANGDTLRVGSDALIGVRRTTRCQAAVPASCRR